MTTSTRASVATSTPATIHRTAAKPIPPPQSPVPMLDGRPRAPAKQRRRAPRGMGLARWGGDSSACGLPRDGGGLSRTRLGCRHFPTVDLASRAHHGCDILPDRRPSPRQPHRVEFDSSVRGGPSHGHVLRAARQPRRHRSTSGQRILLSSILLVVNLQQLLEHRPHAGLIVGGRTPSGRLSDPVRRRVGHGVSGPFPPGLSSNESRLSDALAPLPTQG